MFPMNSPRRTPVPGLYLRSRRTDSISPQLWWPLHPALGWCDLWSDLWFTHEIFRPKKVVNLKSLLNVRWISVLKFHISDVPVGFSHGSNEFCQHPPTSSHHREGQGTRSPTKPGTCRPSAALSSASSWTSAGRSMDREVSDDPDGGDNPCRIHGNFRILKWRYVSTI